MNPSEVLGMALNDYYFGRTPLNIIVHSPDFDPDTQSVSYYFRRFDEMPEIEKEALRLTRGKVLDMGAAAGAHSLELQRRGFDVTALELSYEACKIMKLRGVDKTLNCSIFDSPVERYDTILMLMNGIGLVQTLNGLSDFMRHIKGFLNPGGQVLFDSANLIYLFRDIEPDEANSNRNERYYGEIEFVMEYKGIKSESFFWLYIDFDTLCHYAEKEDLIPELIFQDQNFQYLARLVFP
jgi:2-polyprenyl-3-methyl-5-hydroxy-6-metoxy-1,4-benzoquinol methylase